MPLMKKLTSLFLAFAVGLFHFTPANAQSISIIRDTEIEALVRDYALPILRAANVNANAVDIIIVNSREFNAFVVSGRLMFINAGLLMEAETPNEVIGIIAHETGHIAGGHNIRLRQQIENAQMLAGIAMALGGAAMVGGSMAGNQSAADAGAAIAMGGQQAAILNLLAYRRSEEDAADQSALRYLEATGQSARGMIRTFEKFASQEMFTGRGTDPYGATHPEARARIANIQPKAEASRFYNTQDDPALLERHRMMQAKLFGYLEHPNTVARRYGTSDSSIPALYARAIAAVRSQGMSDAVRIVDQLIQRQPNNPYFWEMRGDAMLRSRNADEAVRSYARAMELAPNADLIRVGYASALFAQGNVNAAITHFERGLARERVNSLGFTQLARAYAQAGREAEASLATARAMLIDGNLREAQNFARRAQERTSRGSAVWIQAQDIIQIRGN